MNPARRAWLALGAMVLVRAAPASADVPRRVVGEPPGFAVRERLDPERRGLSSSLLPRAPREHWHAELQAALEVPPLVDAQGHVVALLASGVVVGLDREARPVFRRPMPCPVSNVPPVFGSDGALLVLCVDGTLQRVRTDGQRLDPFPLEGPALRVRAAPHVREDGSVTVALDEELVTVASDGEVLARARFGGHEALVGALVPFEGGVLGVTARGDVWSWRAPLAPTRLGTFGGTVLDGAVLFGSRAFVATVGGDRLVRFDLLTRQASTLASAEGGARFDSLPALLPGGELAVTTSSLDWLALAPSGEPKRILAFESVRRTAATTFRGTSALARGGGRTAPMVVDREGFAAVAFADGRFAVVPKDGEPVIAKGPACAHPLAILPAGEKRAIVACASGTLILWVDR